MPFSTMSQFEQVGYLGKGGFGKVDAMRDFSDPKGAGKIYAVKKIEIDFIRQFGSDANQADQRIYQEADLMRSLDHFNIVKVFASFEEAGIFHIVMEYCEGGTLKQAISEQNGHHFSEEYVCYLTAQIVMALRYLHDIPIIHRDVKTENIFFTDLKKQTLKLGDFGVAKSIDSKLASTHTDMPPEIFKGEHFTLKSDAWSLGIVVFELSALELPFKGDEAAINNNEIPKIPSTFSRNLQDLVAKEMLVRNPDERSSIRHIGRNASLKDAMQKLEKEAEARQAEYEQELSAKGRKNIEDQLAAVEKALEIEKADHAKAREKKTSRNGGEMIDDGQVEPTHLQEEKVARDAEESLSRSCDYFLQWNKAVKLSDSCKFYNDGPSWISAILVCADNKKNSTNDGNNSQEEVLAPNIVIVHYKGEIVALSSRDWRQIEWQGKVSLKFGKEDGYIEHAVYDDVAGAIYFAIGVSGKLDAIYRANISEIAASASKNERGVPVQILINQTQSDGRNFYGLALDSSRRLLFACDQLGKFRDISIWLLLSSQGTSSGAVLLGSIDCHRFSENIMPYFCSVYSFGDDYILAVSDFKNERIELFVASLAALDKAISKKQQKQEISQRFNVEFRHLKNAIPDAIASPYELHFDQFGNLFATESNVFSSGNHRLWIFSLMFQRDKSEDGKTAVAGVRLAWRSDKVGEEFGRVTVAVNPKTQKPATLFANWTHNWIACIPKLDDN